MTPALPAVVSDIMTSDVLTVEEDDNLLNMLRAMHTLRFRHTPVTDEGRLVGLLTERDVLAFSASTLLPNRAQSDQLLGERFHIRDVMKRDVKAVAPATSIKEAVSLMLQERIGCLPVVDADNRVVGIVTSTDLHKLLYKLLPG